MNSAQRANLPSALGFGVSGPHGTPLIRCADTVKLVHGAFDAGVRVFDTAPAYGAGEAERRLGLALRDIARDAVFVTTKAGLSSAGVKRRLRDFSPQAIERSLLASLERLGIEGVDGLILHGPSPSELTPELHARLSGLKAAGAFRFLGVAGRGPELDVALETGSFEMLMAPVHPFAGEQALARLRSARSSGIAVMGIEAAGGGPAPLSWPRSLADLYKLAQSIRSGSGAGPRLPMPGALVDPVQGGLADCVLVTTTRERHLSANAAAVRAAMQRG